MFLPNQIPLSILIVLSIFITITFRNFLKIEIWKIMLLGAILNILTNQISISDAFHAIDFEVLIFLASMFIFGFALEESGLLFSYTGRLLNGRKNIVVLFLLFSIISAIGSALFLNDTIAIIGTSIALLIAHQLKISSRILLYLLAFSVTIGSVFSPIGNPQNFLIAKAMKNPFSEFFFSLTIPTLINLIITVFLVYKIYEKELPHKKVLVDIPLNIFDHELARACKVSIFFLLVTVLGKLIMHFEFPLVFIGLIIVLPIFLMTKRRRIALVKEIDWHTLLFFASMFIVMESAWKSNFFQDIISKNNMNIHSLENIFLISIVGSQLMSNVPLVMLYLPLLIGENSIDKLIALAAASTIAGNLSVLGAASNVIIIQQAEKKKEFSFNALEFFKIGIIVTILNSIIYMIFLMY